MPLVISAHFWHASPIMETPTIYTPLCPSTVHQGQGPALLLQFALFELLKTPHPSKEAPIIRHLPFDFAKTIGSFNKLQEHASLLPHAFPHLKEEANLLCQNLHKPSKKLFSLIEPFVLACKENENLLYFLLQYRKSAPVKSLLAKISPQGIEPLQKYVVAKYDKRGFSLPPWTN